MAIVSMKLDSILKRENNNLDIFRLFAALLVIFGHAYVLSAIDGVVDPISNAFELIDSGDIAVKLFFFLSGLVVTNSFLEKKDVLQFCIARFFRIWPAFTFVVVVSALIIGPIITNLTVSEYFQNKTTYGYILKNIIMDINFILPGVFNGNPYKDAVNGSIWTIPYEIGAYLVLIILFLFGILRKRILATIIAILIILDPIFGNKLIFTWLSGGAYLFLAPSFAFGALLALHQDRIIIDYRIILGSLLAYYIFRHSPLEIYFLYGSIFTSVLYLSTTKFFLKCKLPFDLSYGIYLWGFVIQQIIALYFYNYGILFNQISSMLICVVLAYITWHLVEKPWINMGRKVATTLGKKTLIHKKLCSTSKEISPKVSQ